MTYKLAFMVDALKEWNKLDNTINEQFKNKLKEQLKTLESSLLGYQG